MLQQAKTPEERQKILKGYKELMDWSNSEESSKWAKKVIKNQEKHKSKINSLNKREKEFEDKLRKKGVSDEDRAKYEAEIKKIEKIRHKLVEG